MSTAKHLRPKGGGFFYRPPAFALEYYPHRVRTTLIASETDVEEVVQCFYPSALYYMYEHMNPTCLLTRTLLNKQFI